jgi:hypothetical protein
MTIHTWVRRNLAAYVTGGLAAAERRRLERHVAACPECARALDAARSGDRALAALFADVQPGPGLEDEAIRRLRQALPPSERWRFSRKVRALLAVAAAVLLAASGAGLGALIEEDRLKFPGEVTVASAEERSSFGVVKQRGLNVDILAGSPLIVLDSTESMKYPEKLAQEMHERTKQLTQGTAGRRQIYLHNLSNLSSDLSPSDPFRFTDGTSNSFAFSPDGRRTATNIKRWREGTSLWDADKKKEQADLRTYQRYFKPGDTYAMLGPKGTQKPGDEGLRPPDKRPATSEGADQGKPGRDVNGEPAKKPPTAEGDKEKGQKPPPPPDQAAQPAGRKIIRSGEIEFEVDSFDAATAVITRLVATTKGGFVATVNSEKLANGKVRGSVVVRVPPEQLDALVLALRKDLGKFGELKGQRIGSQDITKQYTDLESRLKAARTMEGRLLKIIQEAKGQIKDLLQAEKELGVWRSLVEVLEGELRYYAHQVALSTLTIVLTEKDIRTAAGVIERERVQAGVEVEDVEAAMHELLKAVADAKGRVTRSEMKQHGAGQFNALMHFEVAPEKAGPVRDRLRQLGTVARLEIDRVQQAENGGTLPKDGKLTRGDTQFYLSLYNLANVGPRETITLKVAAADVAAAYRTLREAVARASGREINAQLNEQDRLNVTAQLEFNVPRAAEKSVQAVLAQFGEVLSRSVTRKAEKEKGKDKDQENLTDAKLGFNVELLPTAAIPPRATITLAVEVADVEAALAVLAAQVKEAGGMVLAPRIDHEPSGRVTAHVLYRVPLTAESGMVAKVRSAGKVRAQRQDPDLKAPEGKLAVAHLKVTLSNAELLVPSEQGLWAQVRHGLSVSLRGLSWSASWLIVGLLFVLPWLLLIYAVVWLARRLFRGSPARASAPAGAEGSGQ